MKNIKWIFILVAFLTLSGCRVIPVNLSGSESSSNDSVFSARIEAIDGTTLKDVEDNKMKNVLAFRAENDVEEINIWLLRKDGANTEFNVFKGQRIRLIIVDGNKREKSK